MSSDQSRVTHPVGSKIASNAGAVLYEDNAGQSLSGGAAPTTGQGVYTSGQPGQSVHTASQPAGGSFPSIQPAGVGNLGASSPNVTDVGLSSGGQTLTDKVRAANDTPQHSTDLPMPWQQVVAVGSGIGSVSDQTTTGVPPTGTAYEQISRGAQVVANKAQELSQPVQPYIQKVQETVAPYVQTAVDKASPIVQQAQEAASPYVSKASELANQGIQVAATELDKRGVNLETSQQKLADVGQSLKDYGAVGQARAGEYFQQAVDQAKAIGEDRENKNIFTTVFGTLALIWLAFGFSITALLALGVAGTIAAVLSRYSRATVGTQSGTVGTAGNRSTQSGTVGTAGNRSSGVETHYPNPAHPDSSLHNQK